MRVTPPLCDLQRSKMLRRCKNNIFNFSHMIARQVATRMTTTAANLFPNADVARRLKRKAARLAGDLSNEKVSPAGLVRLRGECAGTRAEWAKFSRSVFMAIVATWTPVREIFFFEPFHLRPRNKCAWRHIDGGSFSFVITDWHANERESWNPNQTRMKVELSSTLIHFHKARDLTRRDSRPQSWLSSTLIKCWTCSKFMRAMRVVKADKNALPTSKSTFSQPFWHRNAYVR